MRAAVAKAAGIRAARASSCLRGFLVDTSASPANALGDGKSDSSCVSVLGDSRALLWIGLVTCGSRTVLSAGSMLMRNVSAWGHLVITMWMHTYAHIESAERETQGETLMYDLLHEAKRWKRRSLPMRS